MMWGLFSLSSQGPLVKLQSILISVVYRDHVLDYCTILCLLCFLVIMVCSSNMMQTPHCVQVTHNSFQDHLANLNPIEHAWDMVQASPKSLQPHPPEMQLNSCTILKHIHTTPARHWLHGTPLWQSYLKWRESLDVIQWLSYLFGISVYNHKLLVIHFRCSLTQLIKWNFQNNFKKNKKQLLFFLKKMAFLYLHLLYIFCFTLLTAVYLVTVLLLLFCFLFGENS